MPQTPDPTDTFYAGNMAAPPRFGNFDSGRTRVVWLFYSSTPVQAPAYEAVLFDSGEQALWDNSEFILYNG